MNVAHNLKTILKNIPRHVNLVAVSKTKPVEQIQEAYNSGQRIFGENKVQEMASKYDKLPKDIQWHMIGHLQSNKVKYMAHFVDLIHGVDSFNTLKEINKQAKKHNRIIKCLLQLKIATEESKFGIEEQELLTILSLKTSEKLSHVKIVGLMGMASFVENTQQIQQEFKTLKNCYDKLIKTHPYFNTLSMGMSGDYQIAIEQGSTMVRIGSAIFGGRN